MLRVKFTVDDGYHGGHGKHAAKTLGTGARVMFFLETFNKLRNTE